MNLSLYIYITHTPSIPYHIAISSHIPNHRHLPMPRCLPCVPTVATRTARTTRIAATPAASPSVLSAAAPPERRIADAWAGKKNGKNMVTRHGNYMIYMVTIREYHTMLTYGLFRIIITIYDMIILMVMFVFDHDASFDDSI